MHAKKVDVFMQVPNWFPSNYCIYSACPSTTFTGARSHHNSLSPTQARYNLPRQNSFVVQKVLLLPYFIGPWLQKVANGMKVFTITFT